MDCVTPILDVATRLWTCTAERIVYIRRLPRNLKILRTAMEELRSVYEDVIERVESEEKLQKKRTRAVEGWIRSVEAMEKEIKEILEEGDEEVQNKCLGTCCPRDSYASYKLGKRVSRKIRAVAALRSKANHFHEVAVPLPSPPVIERPLEKTVGLDSPFLEVWRWLQDEQIRTIGIYGMGGVGKTALLKKINNKFLQPSHDFDVVIWVVVSKPTNLQRVHETLRNKLEIPDGRWKNRSEDEKAAEIFAVLKTKKFVLLLDDIWEPLDLLKVGIPLSTFGNMSKIVFTTRSADVCRDMEAQKSIKVECLAWEEALTLFWAKVGEDTLNSHPDILKLSEIVVGECKGLPLALIIIGRAMAGARTPEDWEKKIKMLKNYPAKFPGMGDSLFPVLAFSYDSLPDEAVKSCFLYCSLFPEDYEISPQHLIELWLGEGFLDEYDGIQAARNQGEEIIERLKDVCLLENGRSQKQEYLKMHDVIRDMALWLASENGKKKNKFVVKDQVGLIRAHEVEKWNETQRISLWESRIEELREPPCFPNIETFSASGKCIKSFPSGFFAYMPIIRVLDLSNNYELIELPVEIGNLVNLQYLNLSRTSIENIPVELKNLKNLKYLILDNMNSLQPLPSQMLSVLSSLQLFSMFNSPYKGDHRTLLEDLEQLEYINDISIDLTTVFSAQALFNSHKLQSSTRRLRLFNCKSLNLVQLSPYIETLHISFCHAFKDVQISLEKEVLHSKFPRHGYCLYHLCHVSISWCSKLLNLTWLIYAPNLKFLSIDDCGSLEEVVEIEKSEVSELELNFDLFSRLVSLTLINLPKLRSICRWRQSFPSLREITVLGCPRIRKLPFDSDTGTSKNLEKIIGEQEWWDGLEWEDKTIMHSLTPYFRTTQSSKRLEFPFIPLQDRHISRFPRCISRFLQPPFGHVDV
ncbi:probable disease resistance protein At5g63020 isoform X2 [Vitis riparia]|uniref:probable disease resistance protein At5g63020 isoform X2 n=1 Tax=Vitis riparia TaxID=96939 RepID=UPI00155ACEA5|nr:probable disease resistance protein At5g63020 isoform X2 [Vitis riparia]